MGADAFVGREGSVGIALSHRMLCDASNVGTIISSSDARSLKGTNSTAETTLLLCVVRRGGGQSPGSGWPGSRGRGQAGQRGVKTPRLRKRELQLRHEHAAPKACVHHAEVGPVRHRHKRPRVRLRQPEAGAACGPCP